MKRHVIALGIFAILLAGCTRKNPEQKVTLTSPNGDTVEVAVEIADTDEERATGLMNRTELPEGTGMLFVFDTDEVRSFWMKNTLIPLDVLFFNQHGVFVSSSTMDPCTKDPCMSYLSALPARFALEAPAGFTERADVGIGWKLEMKNEK